MPISQQEIMLIHAAQNGNEQSFAQLYNIYYQKIYALALTTTKNTTDAEDVLQITFLKAWQHISTLQNAEAFNTWIQRIAINESNTLLGKRKPNISLDNNDEDNSPVPELESDLMLPEAYAEQEDLSARLRRIIFNLSDVQRQTIMLFYFESLTIPEIAEVMDCSENTVKSRLFLARKAIKTEIEEQERKTGTKFFGIVGIPMLPFGNIFVNQVRRSAISPARAMQIFSNIHQAVGVTAASAGASAGIGTAAGMSASTGAVTGMSLATKILITVLAGVIAIGAATAGVLTTQLIYDSNAETEPVATTAQTETIEPTTEAVTEPATEATTEPDYTEAFSAYRNILQSEQSGINNFVWQLGTDNESRPIILADIMGDETPELIYEKATHMMNSTQGMTQLNIVSFIDGKAVTVYQTEENSWSQNEAGAEDGTQTMLFQINGEKTLYAAKREANQFGTKIFYRFDENGNNLSQSEYTGSSSDLLNNISHLLMMSDHIPSIFDIDTSSVKNEAMTYDEVISLFDNAVGDESEQKSEGDVFDEISGKKFSALFLSGFGRTSLDVEDDGKFRVYSMNGATGEVYTDLQDQFINPKKIGDGCYSCEDKDGKIYYICTPEATKESVPAEVSNEVDNWISLGRNVDGFYGYYFIYQSHGSMFV